MINADIDGVGCVEAPRGIFLSELAGEYQRHFRYPIIAAKVNNEIRELSFRLEDDAEIKFIDLTDADGMRIYRRSLIFLLIKAVKDLFPERKTIIKHSISKGIYAEVLGDTELTAEEVAQIEAEMRKLVAKRIPFVKHEMSVEEAREILIKHERMDRYIALEFRKKPYVTVYSCDGFYDYFYGYMAPDTGYLQKFELKYYPPGLIIMFPDQNNPDTIPPFVEQKKLFGIFREYKNWVKILGIENAGILNDIVRSGRIGEVIRISEALHEKKIARIADLISENVYQKKIVLIAGPSSSGKTTFAHRLSIQLRVNGLKPVTVNLDDYFLNRIDTPKDENGEYDYEALEALDTELFNEHLNKLISGEEVEIPIFDFYTGTRKPHGRKIRLDENGVLLIEGIHGLNERLTPSIPRERKFKVYVSALTSLNIDDHNRIPSTDARMIRRITRDHKYRGNSALDTIRRWPSVRKGEDRNIFPFQEEADVMFNSALLYEIGVLKVHAEPLLMEIDRNCPEYSEARRLLEFLGNFLPIPSDEIPANSIIREFIGGSCFY